MPDEPQFRVSEWWRISGILPLYIHVDDPRLAPLRKRITAMWAEHIARSVAAELVNKQK